METQHNHEAVNDLNLRMDAQINGMVHGEYPADMLDIAAMDFDTSGSNLKLEYTLVYENGSVLVKSHWVLAEA